MEYKLITLNHRFWQCSLWARTRIIKFDCSPPTQAFLGRINHVIHVLSIPPREILNWPSAAIYSASQWSRAQLIWLSELWSSEKCWFTNSNASRSENGCQGFSRVASAGVWEGGGDLRARGFPSMLVQIAVVIFLSFQAAWFIETSLPFKSGCCSIVWQCLLTSIDFGGCLSLIWEARPWWVRHFAPQKPQEYDIVTLQFGWVAEFQMIHYKHPLKG